MPKILILDNYDSFTYNLVHALEHLSGQAVDVFRNDEISLEAVDQYDKIVLSPGPGLPAESGIMLDLIRHYAPTKSILGVCLGHQAIGEAFGGTLENLSKVFHGLATPADIVDLEEPLFQGLPQKQSVGRYHSWVVAKGYLPDCLKITALDEEGQIMAMRHKTYNVRGVQFHPESILTEHGEKMLANWLNRV